MLIVLIVYGQQIVVNILMCVVNKCKVRGVGNEKHVILTSAIGYLSRPVVYI